MMAAAERIGAIVKQNKAIYFAVHEVKKGKISTEPSNENTLFSCNVDKDILRLNLYCHAD